MLRKMLFWIGLSLMIFNITNQEIYAQFGKNKVQYQEFDWKYIQTSHFDIYYNSGSKHLADFAGVEIEKALTSVQATLNFKLTKRVIVVVYDSHNEFQQTNVIGSFMPEGVGGVTELMKNRVVIPFQGDYSQFRHVMHHELLHAVINDMFYGGTIQTALLSGNLNSIPLWINEGLAEFESIGGMNVETDQYMRDLTISEYLPPLMRLDGYLAYRGGQTFYWYVADKYGKGRITDLINKLRIYKDIDKAFLASFNMSLKDFSEKWERDIKKNYWPDLNIFVDPRDFAKKLTDREETGNFYNSSPAISPDGEKLAYISDRDGLFSVYIQDLDKKGQINKVVSSLRAKDFEDLNILTPGISWDPTGKKLAISAKAGGEDAIFITDIKSEDYEKLTFNLKSITSVTWSNNGKYLAFIASKIEKSDLYVYDIQNKKLLNLTNDIFSDTHPVWTSDSKYIYFISDRKDNIQTGTSADNFRMSKFNYEGNDIYRFDIDKSTITRITSDPENLKSTLAVNKDNTRLIYNSDKNGISNLYELNFNTGNTRPITNSLNTISQISLANDDSKLVFTAQVKAGYDLYMMRNPFDIDIKMDELPLTNFKNKIVNSEKLISEITNASDSSNVQDSISSLVGYGDFEIDFANQNVVQPNIDAQINVNNKVEPEYKSEFIEKDYKITFSTDYINVNPGYSTYYGFQSVNQVLFSDVLGNHQIVAQANLITDLNNSQLYVGYAYLPHVIDYNFSLHHSSVLLYNSNYYIYRYRNYGLTASASYPLDLFRRFEFSTGFYMASKEPIDNVQDPTVSKFIFTPQLSYVYDNSLGGIYAPTIGSRFNIEVYGSPKFVESSVGFITFKTDFRHYIPLSDYFTFALRGTAGTSLGPDPQQFRLGGTDNWINRSLKNNQLPFDKPEDFVFMQNIITPLRGWSISEISGNKFFAANAEFRFPLLTALVAGPLPILIQGVMGSFFVDAGGAWDKNFVAAKKDENGNLKHYNMITSTGMGIRSYLLGMPFKVDIAWRYDYSSWSQPQYLFSLGYDF